MSFKLRSEIVQLLLKDLLGLLRSGILIGTRVRQLLNVLLSVAGFVLLNVVGFVLLNVVGFVLLNVVGFVLLNVAGFVLLIVDVPVQLLIGLAAWTPCVESKQRHWPVIVVCDAIQRLKYGLEEGSILLHILFQ
jgi:hypothetical protein